MSYFGTTDYFVQVGKGLVPKHSLVEAIGFSDNIGASMSAIAGAEVYQTPTVAITLEAISDDANDTAAGTGAQKIMVVGLDANWDLQEVEITMAGLSASTATTETWLRVLDAYVSEAGTYVGVDGDSNAGNITVRVAAAGITYAEIAAGKGEAHIGAYTVPNGYTAQVIDYGVQVDEHASASAQLAIREGADDVTTPFTGKKVIDIMPGNTGNINRMSRIPTVLPAKTDVGLLASTPNGTAEVGGWLNILLVQD